MNKTAGEEREEGDGEAEASVRILQGRPQTQGS